MKRLSSAAEALRARWQNHEKFLSVHVAPEGIVLLMRPGFEVKTHRAIEGHPVLVRECEEFRP